MRKLTLFPLLLLSLGACGAIMAGYNKSNWELKQGLSANPTIGVVEEIQVINVTNSGRVAAIAPAFKGMGELVASGLSAELGNEGVALVESRDAAKAGYEYMALVQVSGDIDFDGDRLNMKVQLTLIDNKTGDTLGGAAFGARAIGQAFGSRLPITLASFEGAPIELTEVWAGPVIATMKASRLPELDTFTTERVFSSLQNATREGLGKWATEIRDATDPAAPSS